MNPTPHQRRLAENRVNLLMNGELNPNEVVELIAADYVAENDRGRRAVVRDLDGGAQQVREGERRHGALDLIRLVRDTYPVDPPRGPDRQIIIVNADAGVTWRWDPTTRTWLGRS